MWVFRVQFSDFSWAGGGNGKTFTSLNALRRLQFSMLRNEETYDTVKITLTSNTGTNVQLIINEYGTTTPLYTSTIATEVTGGQVLTYTQDTADTGAFPVCSMTNGCVYDFLIQVME